MELTGGLTQGDMKTQHEGERLLQVALALQAAQVSA